MAKQTVHRRSTGITQECISFFLTTAELNSYGRTKKFADPVVDLKNSEKHS